MLRISIDGACRRNGKPDCVSAGGVFIQTYTGQELISNHTISEYELNSTSQRGEILALLTALRYIKVAMKHLGIQMCETQIITDSEYLFNTMNKEWVYSWSQKGWITSTGEPVKNRDLWEQILAEHSYCTSQGIEITFYHIKGHVIPFGKVTASTLLRADASGGKLLKALYDKYDATLDNITESRLLLLDKANTLSLKNNGFELTPKLLRDFVVNNTMADIIATECVEAADTLMQHMK